MSPTFSITPATFPTELATITTLFTAFAHSLAIDLTFQNFSAELAELPGAYAPPTGTILLARRPGGEALGCVALRPINSTTRICEVKRLYVSPVGRGLSIGRALVEAVMAETRRLGYALMRLDTLPEMTAARALYAVLGFREVGAYYVTPLTGTIFLELDLRGEAARTA